MYSVDYLTTLYFSPIMPALCWHNKTTYYAHSNASILYVLVSSSQVKYLNIVH
jgi:hypothetical protein